MEKIQGQCCFGLFGEWRRGASAFVFVGLGNFHEGFGMELACEIFDGGSDARSGSVDGVADDSKSMVLHGVQDTPAGKAGEGVGDTRGVVWMRFGEDQEFRLEANNFFKIYLRPILGRVDDGNSARVLQGIGDESVFADGDKGFGPDDKHHAPGR